MNTRSFNKITSIATLLVFLAVPNLAFAQLSSNDSQTLITLLALKNSGNISQQQLVQLVALQQLQSQQQNQGANQNGLGAGMNPLLLAGALGGGLGGNSGAGGAGGAAQAGQFLALAGLLSGNMGLAMAGMLMSMLGGLASSAGGGAGSTPQTGKVDEQYVAPGQAGPSGIAANNPYYTAPVTSTVPTTSPAPACSQSIFIVKDTTANPATTKPYPATLTIPQTDCALVINADSASHSLNGNSVAAQASQIFRFASKKVYKMCIDNSTTACTSVTVQ